MADAADVARWLYKKVMQDGVLTHKNALYHVRERFGPAFLTENENGNPALDAEVLRLFRRYIYNKAEWNREDLAWRRLPGRVADDEE